jgi:hypothetical protein
VKSYPKICQIPRIFVPQYSLFLGIDSLHSQPTKWNAKHCRLFVVISIANVGTLRKHVNTLEQQHGRCIIFLTITNKNVSHNITFHLFEWHQWRQCFLGSWPVRELGVWSLSSWVMTSSRRISTRGCKAGYELPTREFPARTYMHTYVCTSVYLCVCAVVVSHPKKKGAWEKLLREIFGVNGWD